MLVQVQSHVQIVHCSVDGNQKTSTSGTVTFKEDPSEPFVNYYEYLELGECKKGLDNWGTLYPVTPIPKQTPRQTPFNFIYTMKQIIPFF